ncbi:Bug family tripartite tricarboxylate transporter substrate binding protein [Microbulbifer sp. S227A]|uniref:Bug family tripartite tricarboxylate transporter substrate binding protein n=1 Tax=Microbulbifer sp. S227A TaxID=3415131 RepID=UPI003C7E7CCD
MFTRAKAALIGALAVTVATVAQAGDYPSKPINVIIPFPAGSNLDIITRIPNEALSKELGVPVNSINVPGGGTVPAVMKFLGAEADGYTLLRWVAPTLVTNPIMRDVPYDPRESIVPIFHDATNSNVLYVKGDSEFETFQQFVEAAKSRKLLIGINAIGAPPHMSVAQLNMLFDIELPVLAQKSIPNSMAGLIGGQTDAAIGQLKQQEAYGDEIRALAILDRRLPHFERYLPGIKTAEELTGQPSDSWINGGYAVKAGTPPEIMERLVAAAEKVMNNDAYRASVEKYTVPTWVGGVEDTKALVAEGWHLYEPIITQLGLAQK